MICFLLPGFIHCSVDLISIKYTGENHINFTQSISTAFRNNTIGVSYMKTKYVGGEDKLWDLNCIVTIANEVQKQKLEDELHRISQMNPFNICEFKCLN